MHIPSAATAAAAAAAADITTSSVGVALLSATLRSSVAHLSDPGIVALLSDPAFVRASIALKMAQLAGNDPLFSFPGPALR